MLSALLALAIAAPKPGQAFPAQLEQVELRDQLGRAHRLSELSGAPRVVLVVTARRLRQIEAWERALRRRFKELGCVRICDVPAAPPTTYERVVARLRGRVPDEAPVLIDMGRVWAQAYGLDTREVNALVLSARGTLVSSVRGPRSALALRDLERLVERALAAGASGP